MYNVVGKIGGILEMKLLFKRIGAYILDMVLVMLVSSLVSSLTFINKDYKEYNSTYNEYSDKLEVYQNFIADFEDYYKDEEINDEEYSNLLSDYSEFSIYITNRYDDKEINNEEYEQILDDLLDKYKDEYILYNYELSKLNVISSIILIVCIILYFGITQYFMNGQTLGKRIFSLKVVNKNGEKAGLVNLLIRTVIVTGILISISQIVCIFILNKNDYYTAAYYMKTVSYGIEFMILITVLLRMDGRGLHDLIAKTKVIDMNNRAVNDNMVIEAQYAESDNSENKKD